MIFNIYTFPILFPERPTNQTKCYKSLCPGQPSNIPVYVDRYMHNMVFKYPYTGMEINARPLARGELNLCWATLCDHSSRPAGDLSKKKII